MPLLKNIGLLAACRPEGGQGKLHTIQKAALAWEGEKITWVGPESDLPAGFDSVQKLDAGGKMVIPGLIDCHTHLGFGGWRSREFEQRLSGISYLEIARRGGGINATVEATRKTSLEELVQRCQGFLAEMSRLGITTVEAKSGYGLNLKDEIKILSAYREVRRLQPVRIVSTCLAAHTIPKEFRKDRNRYVDLVCEEIIPAAGEANLAEFCDVFVEEGAFTRVEARRILERGREFGMLPKLHADQLTDGRGAALASELEAVSADHLECVSPEGIRALCNSGVTAVALPIAALYLRQGSMPARRLIEAGVRVAVSTDFNPGSAPSYHLPLALMLSCVRSGMTPSEALKGATMYAAEALNLQHATGSLEVGKSADFVLIDAPDPAHWLYHFCANRCVATYIRGKKIYAAAKHSREIRLESDPAL